MTKVAALAGMLSALSACGSVAGRPADPRGADLGAPPALCQAVAKCSRPVHKDGKVDCMFSMTDGSGAVLYANHAGLEYRGRSSLEYPKKNYALELRDATGTSLPTNLLGMGEGDDWILDGSWADRSFMRNPLVLDSYASLGTSRYGAESRFCTFSLNGANQGIYRLGETIKRDDDRLAIAADDGTGASFIIKQDDSGILSFPIRAVSHLADDLPEAGHGDPHAARGRPGLAGQVRGRAERIRPWQRQ